MKAKLFTDGGARGNPGPAAYGYVLEAEDGRVLAAKGERIGVATNNVAEYRALLAGLEKALELSVPELEVVSDSELLVKQMRGEYKVKNAALRELSVEATRLARELGAVTYTAVRREENEEVALALERAHPELERLSPDLPSDLVRDGFLRTWPHLHDMDGFFAAAWHKV